MDTHKHLEATDVEKIPLTAQLKNLSAAGWSNNRSIEVLKKL